MEEVSTNKTISGNILKKQKCDVCENVFKTEKKLEKHLSTIHGNVIITQEFKCNICLKSFKYKRNLTVHIRTVHGRSKDYKCKSCGKSFSLKHNLKTHIHIKAIKITNVNLALNLFLWQHVNLVVNHFLVKEIWRNILTQFMKATKIRNVNLVANYFLKQNH